MIMAKQYKVVAPMVFLKYYDGAGTVVQADFLAGRVVSEVEDEQNPAPGQVTKASIDHHLETEQIVSVS
jgi:hypothetical protein